MLGHTQSNVTGRYAALTEGDIERTRKLTNLVVYWPLTKGMTEFVRETQ